MDYAATAARARSLIARYGAQATITRTVAVDYDADTGTASDSVTSTYVGYGVQTNYRLADVPGSQIQTDDVRLFVAIDVAPRPSDALVFAGTRYAVVSCQPIAPNGVPILYDVS